MAKSRSPNRLDGTHAHQLQGATNVPGEVGPFPPSQATAFVSFRWDWVPCSGPVIPNLRYDRRPNGSMFRTHQAAKLHAAKRGQKLIRTLQKGCVIRTHLHPNRVHEASNNQQRLKNPKKTIPVRYPRLRPYLRSLYNLSWKHCERYKKIVSRSGGCFTFLAAKGYRL